MTDILFKRLADRFPLCDNCDISVYENYERIYVHLANPRFSKSPQFNSHNKIKNLASIVFDVDFVYEKRGEIGPAIFFEPKKRDSYSHNHQDHSLHVHLPSKFPMVTIDTGNRGSTILMNRQRDNYFKFVEETFNLFLNNVKK